MFTCDFDPNQLGRTESLAVNWVDFGFGFILFLSEGVFTSSTSPAPVAGMRAFRPV